MIGKHWPALLVLGVGLARNLRSQEPSWVEIVLICLAGAGVVMNSLVILLNRGMPVAASLEEISAEQRGWYHPISDRTRLPWLADWIDVGWAWYSPGDFFIDIAAIGLIVRAVYHAFV